MVAPLVYYTNTVDLPDGSYFSLKKGYKQARPHNIVTAYERQVRQTRVTRGGNVPRSFTSLSAMPSNVGNQLLDSAYEKLKGRIADQAQLGANLGELGKSLTMIENRSMQIFQFARHLRRGNLVQASKALGLDGVPSKAGPHKSMASNWLEYHLGWAPTVGDIYSAVNVLQSPVKESYPRASARGPIEKLIYVPELKYEKPYGVGTCPNQYHAEHKYEWFEGSRSVYMGCEVSVTNPNLYLANQLGLVNLASIAHELVPLSFVADWFTNIGSFLSQGTDFLGLRLDKAFTTTVLTGNRTKKVYSDCYYWANGRWNLQITDRFNVDKITHMIRTSGISKPALFVRPFRLWGWQRAATAVSLVIQQLK